MAQAMLSLFSWGTQVFHAHPRGNQNSKLTNETSIKSLLIFFAPVLLPRVINAYRTLRVRLAHRPPPRPIPSKANRALNVLFGAIVVSLILSVPINPHAPAPNIFSQTGSRITTPTDVIFARLARFRPAQTLSDYDKLLRSSLTSTAARKIYLRYGPDALVSCQFCRAPGESLVPYLLYYLPWNSVVPHLLHLLVLGVATSAPFAGPDAGRWRNWFTAAGLMLAGLDVYIMGAYDPLAAASAAVRAGQQPPTSLFHAMSVARPLGFALFDSVCAGLIYVSATHRFFFSPPSPAEQIDQLVTAATAALTTANQRLHGVSVARNATVRDKALKARDDWYWQTAVAMETSDAVWEDEEVVRAMSRAMGGHGVDLAQLGVSVGEYVDRLTEGLEREDPV